MGKPWQVCFELGWKSFVKGSIPIGAVVVNETGEIISQGRSLQYEKEGENGYVFHHKLSHAELNALLQVSEFDHPNIRNYTLYTTTEPCPLCFGALVMANVRNLKFAARDRYAGSTDLNNISRYISSKNIKIEGPFSELEKVQITIQTTYELIRNDGAARLLNVMKVDCPNSVELGVKLFEEKTLQKLRDKKMAVSEVFNHIAKLQNI
ncbi:MAG TPA: nucleoside deaminase [Clostridiales bacterium]|nr:nucleoside deaminase [Clostridiales bacterium]